MAAEGIAALGVNPIYLIGQIVNFAILVLVLKKFLYEPVLRKLEERAKQTQKSLETAEELTKKQEAWEEKQKQAMQKLSAETAAIIAQAQKQAGEEKERIVKEAQEEAKNAAASEYTKVEQKLKEQEKRLQEATANLVITTTKKLLSEYLDREAQTTILNKQLKKLGKIRLS